MPLKPRHIFLFILITLSVLLGIAAAFPKNGLPLNEQLSLRFHWQITDTAGPANYADISSIIEESALQMDTLPTEPKEIKIDTIRANAGTLKKKIQYIEYPSGDSTALYTFFGKLEQSSRKRVRVMHYGDSQIEGDRISSYLRHKLQQKFGGSGPGLLPALPPHASSSSILHSASPNWHKHAVYLKRDTILPHRQFGVLGSFARFTTYAEDSTQVFSDPQHAWVAFNRSGMSYSTARQFYTCRVFYGHNSSPTLVKGWVNDSLVWFEELDTVQQVQHFQWDFSSPPKAFKIEMEAVKSPDIYCIALDNHKGVAVDNLPFRGSSGMEFTKLDYQHMASLTRQLNTGLIILQFGVNVVPYSSKSFHFYERSMTRQINYLKTLMPHASVLVIGVSDMSQKKGAYYQTHPNVLKVREAQRMAAKNTGSAFWDMYTAMGGNNSMPSWVFAEPSLASKDFIHFNRRGGNIIAQMLYNALMQEYDHYLDETKELSQKQIP